MSELKNLFVVISPFAGLERTKYKRFTKMLNESTGVEVELRFEDVNFLVKNWPYYTFHKADFIEMETSSVSDNLKVVFQDLVENVAAGTVTPEYVYMQSKAFEQAFNVMNTHSRQIK